MAASDPGKRPGLWGSGHEANLTCRGRRFWKKWRERKEGRTYVEFAEERKRRTGEQRSVEFALSSSIELRSSQRLKPVHLHAGAAAKGDVGEQSVWRNRAEGQTIGVWFLPVVVVEAEGVEANAPDIIAAVDKIAADHVALVDENLGAQKAGDARTRVNGNERTGVGEVRRRGLAIGELHDGEVAAGAHLISGGIHKSVAHLRAGQKLDGFYATGEREIAHEHVDAVVEIAVEMMNETKAGDRESGAGFLGVGAQPGVLAVDGSRLFPKAQMVPAAVAVEALLPGDFLAASCQILCGDWLFGVACEIQESAEFPEHAARGNAVTVVPAGGAKRGVHLVARADEEDVDHVSFFAFARVSARGVVLQEHFDVAALDFVHFERDAGEFRLVGHIKRNIQAQAEIGARWEINFRFGKHGEHTIDEEAGRAVGIVGRKVAQTVGDASLRSIGSEDALNSAPADGLARVVDFHDLGGDGKDHALGSDDAVEDNFQPGGFVLEAQAHPADSSHLAINFQAGGKDGGTVAVGRLNQSGADGGAGF